MEGILPVQDVSKQMRSARSQILQLAASIARSKYLTAFLALEATKTQTRELKELREEARRLEAEIKDRLLPSRCIAEQDTSDPESRSQTQHQEHLSGSSVLHRMFALFGRQESRPLVRGNVNSENLDRVTVDYCLPHELPDEVGAHLLVES